MATDGGGEGAAPRWAAPPRDKVGGTNPCSPIHMRENATRQKRLNDWPGAPSPAPRPGRWMATCARARRPLQAPPPPAAVGDAGGGECAGAAFASSASPPRLRSCAPSPRRAAVAPPATRTARPRPRARRLSSRQRGWTLRRAPSLACCCAASGAGRGGGRHNL